jgi:hypothetical protein
MKNFMKVNIDASNPSILLIDGKKFILEKETSKKIDGVDHGNKIIFKEFNEKEYNDNLNTIIDAIAERTAKKELIRELVKNLDMKTLRRLAKRIDNGELIKKQHGCLGFKIGDAYVELIG